MNEKHYRDFNNLSIIGRLVDDCELILTEKGDQILNFSIASNNYKTTSFFNITKFEKAESKIIKMLKKGVKVLIGGELEQQKWTGKDGKNNYKIIIKCNDLFMLSFPKNEDGELHVPTAKDIWGDKND
jgi:single stranded DNA-binding protein